MDRTVVNVNQIVLVARSEIINPRLYNRYIIDICSCYSNSNDGNYRFWFFINTHAVCYSWSNYR